MRIIFPFFHREHFTRYETPYQIARSIYSKRKKKERERERQF